MILVGKWVFCLWFGLEVVGVVSEFGLNNYWLLNYYKDVYSKIVYVY